MSVRACFHCGLPVPENAAFSTLIEGIARAMCCPGCASVAALLESKMRFVQQADLSHKGLRLLLAGNRLAMQPLKFWLVVKRVDLA